MSLFVSSIVAEYSHDAVISITEPLASDASVQDVESVKQKSADDQLETLSDVVRFVNSFLDPVFCNWVDRLHVTACLDAYVKSFSGTHAACVEAIR